MSSVAHTVLNGAVAAGCYWGMGEGGFAKLKAWHIEQKKRAVLEDAQRDALRPCAHPEGWWMDPDPDPLTYEGGADGEEYRYHRFACMGYVLTHHNQTNTGSATDRHFLFATHRGVTNSVGFNVTPLGGMKCYHQCPKITPRGWGIRQFHVYRWCREEPNLFAKRFPLDTEFYDPNEWKKIERASGKRMHVVISGLIEIQPLKYNLGTGFQRFDKGPNQCASILQLKVEFL